MPRQRMFSRITDTWEICSECGKKTLRIRRKTVADRRLAGTVYVERRCLNRKCEFQERGKEVMRNENAGESDSCKVS